MSPPLDTAALVALARAMSRRVYMESADALTLARGVLALAERLQAAEADAAALRERVDSDCLAAMAITAACLGTGVVPLGAGNNVDAVRAVCAALAALLDRERRFVEALRPLAALADVYEFEPADFHLVNRTVYGADQTRTRTLTIADLRAAAAVLRELGHEP